MVIIGNLMFGWVRNLEASLFGGGGCLNNYGKRHSGQFSSIFKEHSIYPEELEDDFLSNSLPKPLSDFLGSENYSSGSHKHCDLYLTDFSEPLLNLLELGRCIAWRWSESNTVVSICQQDSSWDRPTGFQVCSWIMSACAGKARKS